MTFQFDEREHKYTLNGVQIPSVTQIIRDVGMTNYSNINKETLEYAGDRGTKIHSTLDYYDKGILDDDELHPTLRNYLEQWKKFLNDYGLTILESELMLYHPTYLYAGTIDKIAEDKSKKRYLIDVKSGVSLPSHDIQTSAYEELYRVNTGKKIHQRLCVYLGEDKYKSVGYQGTSSLGIFLSALSIYNWKLKHKIQN